MYHTHLSQALVLGYCEYDGLQHSCPKLLTTRIQKMLQDEHVDYGLISNVVQALASVVSHLKHGSSHATEATVLNLIPTSECDESVLMQIYQDAAPTRLSVDKKKKSAIAASVLWSTNGPEMTASKTIEACRQFEQKKADIVSKRHSNASRRRDRVTAVVDTVIKFMMFRKCKDDNVPYYGIDGSVVTKEPKVGEVEGTKFMKHMHVKCPEILDEEDPDAHMRDYQAMVAALPRRGVTNRIRNWILPVCLRFTVKYRPHVLELQQTRRRLALAGDNSSLDAGTDVISDESDESGDDADTVTSVSSSHSCEEDVEIAIDFNDDEWHVVKRNVEIQEADDIWVEVVIYRHKVDSNRCCVYFGNGEYEGFPLGAYSFDDEILRDHDGDEIVYRLKR